MKKRTFALQNEKIPSLILRLSIPNTIGLLVVSAYSLADSFFVAELGSVATSAVGVTFSLHVLMQAVGYTLGMGAGAILSHALGKNDTEKATHAASVAFFLSLTAGIAIAVTGLLFCTPILQIFGATGNVLEAAHTYSLPLFLSAPSMCTSFTLSQLLRAEGRATYAMAGLMTGSLLNIALDPLLIFTLHLGIAGASIATLISQTLGALVLLSAYFGKRKTIGVLALSRPAFSLSGKLLILGLPSLLRQGLSGVSSILLNRSAAMLEGDAVSSLSLVTRLFLLVFSFCLGLGQAMLPVVGYSMGANDHARAKKAYLFSLVASSLVMLLFSVPLFLFAAPILKIFGASTASIDIGVLALRAQSAVLVLHGTITCTILFLQITNRSFSSALLAAARQGIFFLPLIFWLPARFGASGITLTQPISDALTFLLSIPLLIYSLKAFTTKRDKTDSLAPS